jgi:SAM-dependent methyltransferase
MFTSIQVQILKKIAPGDPSRDDCNAHYAYQNKSKLATLMGEDFFSRIQGKTVVDFGCGEGLESLEMAEKGATRVIGVDIRENVLEIGTKAAAAKGLQDICRFVTSTDEPADIVVSLDAFEHFADPAAILKIMDQLLKPTGEALISFGPTWYHPLGGHLVSVFPWAHILFSEEALMRWRSTIRSDGAKRFGDVEGGLNQMTIARFKRLVADSPFQFAAFEPVAIRKLRPIHNRLTQEFTTAIVRCRLVKKNASRS